MARLIVIGAGISGLSAAWRAAERGFEVDLLESGAAPGGLAGTLREGRCCLDFGPHSFFSHDRQIVQTVRGLFKDSLQPISRKVKFFYKGAYLDYPLTAQGVLFQMGLRPSVRVACSFIKSRFFPGRRAKPEGDEETVEDWAISSFGEFLYRSFFKPYTEQFWKVPCSELSSRSIPTHTRMSFTNTLKVLLRQKTGTRGESLIEREMCPTYYPDTGFAEIAEQIVAAVVKNAGRVHLGCEVTRITELSGGRMRVAYHDKGVQKVIEGERVISTAPLSSLMRMLDPVPPMQAMISADKLEYRPLIVLGMVTRKQNILNCGYLYQLDRPYNRIFEMNEFSSSTSPRNENILAVEIPCLLDGPMWKATQDEIFAICIASLAQDGFIGPGDVEKLLLLKVPYAYPIYRKDYAGNLSRVMDCLKGYRFLSTLGRSGEFMYMDIDECMKRAFALVERMQ